METLDTQYYLTELRANITARDHIKAQVLLSYFPTLAPQLQYRTLFELSRCTSEFAVPLLSSLLSTCVPSNPVVDIIQRMMLDKILEQPALLVSLLEQPEGMEIPCLIELAGTLQMEAAVPCLMTMLHQETSHERLLSLLKALGAIAHPAAISVLSDYLYADTQALVTAAVQGLARIATPAAVQRLAACLGTDEALDYVILDAFATLQDTLALTNLNAALRSQQASIRTHAKTVLQRLGARAVPVLLENLRYGDEPDLLMHSLNVLGLIGDMRAVAPIRTLLHSEPRDPRVRFAAYEALGLLPLQKGAFVLAEGLTDPVEHVRIAAARALERQHNDTVLAGIKNLLSQDTTQAYHIMHALVCAEADTLCMRLLDEASFRPLAVQALRAVPAPAELRRHCAQRLRQHGYTTLAAQLCCPDDPSRTVRQGVVYAAGDPEI